jgi:Phage integrase, N-terminal SAM-like domain
MVGTDLKVISPAATEILGPDVHRLATLHTNAKTDRELLRVWLKSHADGSPHTVRAYRRVGERFIAVLAARGSDLRKATVEDVQVALEVMRTKAGGAPVRPATVNTYVAAVKSFLGFAHRVGYTRFNAAPLIKLKKAPRQIAQRILGELEVRVTLQGLGVVGALGWRRQDQPRLGQPLHLPSGGSHGWRSGPPCSRPSGPDRRGLSGDPRWRQNIERSCTEGNRVLL